MLSAEEALRVFGLAAVLAAFVAAGVVPLLALVVDLICALVSVAAIQRYWPRPIVLSIALETGAAPADLAAAA